MLPSDHRLKQRILSNSPDESLRMRCIREATEVHMQSFRLAAIPTIAITSLLLILASGYSGFAQTPAPPTLAPPLISLAEARVIIDGAVAFTRDQNLNMAVVVVDVAGNLVSADKMDG